MKRLSPVLLWASSLATLFFVAHVFVLPATLEDVDSLNFALGLHDFDPGRHQPHPPGYPIFMALGKLARLVMSTDARALAILGVIFGALAVFPLMSLFGQLEIVDAGAASDRNGLAGPDESMRERRTSAVTAALAAVLTMASPLFWFNALRPLSDIPGLAMILTAQAVLASAFAKQRTDPSRSPEAIAASGQMIVLGAFLSAIAIGFRSQAAFLTLPLLAIVLLQRAGRGAAGALLGSAMTFTIGVLLWAVPLIVASGGLTAYRTALSAQGGEDFAGVDMLYRNPTPRRLAIGLAQTFILPWASTPLGCVVFGLAVIGALALLWRARRAAVVIAALSLPYLAFHLAFQETVTTRYALPLIPVVAFLAVRGARALLSLGRARRRQVALLPLSGGVAALAVWSLLLVVPAARVYARDGSPAFNALTDLHTLLRGAPPVAIGMHEGLSRSVETQHFDNAQVLKSPPMREWLELAQYWRSGQTAPVWFLADPARTDLELIDPLSRHVHQRYVWRFPRLDFISGVRPDVVDLIGIDSPPGWFGEQGWHLTSETLNMSERLRTHDAVAYVRRRSDAALVVIGTEGVPAPGRSGQASLELSLDGQMVERWNVPVDGTSFKRLLLPAGALAGEPGFSRLVVSYAAADGTPEPIRLTQFAVESPDDLFVVQQAGWYEIEYNRVLQRRWRWTSGRAVTFINNHGRDVTLTIGGESPLTYFDAPPHVIVRAGNQVLATASPSSEFELTVPVPASALAAADGMVTIETDRTFVPNERTGSPDKRHLGLRIFKLDAR